MLLKRMLACGIALGLLRAVTAAAAPHNFVLRTTDVVAFVGGSDVAAAQFTGHLETLLAVKFPGARFRNLGWEGDTVFAQPRDFGFPTLTERLKRYGITVVFLEFGRAEALDGKEAVPKFFSAYDTLVNECAQQVLRIVLITPPPFESGKDPLPDLSKRNTILAAHANAVRTLARQRSLTLIDLFAEFGGAAHEEPRLTENGLQLTPRGHALIASGVARQLDFVNLAALAGGIGDDGVWTNKDFETLRQLVIEKNRLWFNYSRPQNWAFLGGDRITQPSSRDHRNPSVRWFPSEMQKYLPLIRTKEIEIEERAAYLR